MKLVKILFTIAIFIALAIGGIFVLNTTGKIEIEINHQLETSVETAEFRAAKKVIHNEDGFWDIQQSFYKVDSREFQKEASYTLTAKEGYNLVAYDKSKNKLGNVEKLEIDDGGSGFGYADFDINNFIGQKYFYIVAEKIVK